MSKRFNINNIVQINVINNMDSNWGNTAETSEYTSYEEFLNQIDECKLILKDLILQNNNSNNQYINVEFGSDIFNSESETLGSAYPNRVIINQYNKGEYYLNGSQEKRYYYLNEYREHQNISVIIHEIFHVFGIFPNIVDGNIIARIDDVTANNDNDADKGKRRVYQGEKGLAGYKNVLLANNIKVPEPLFICIEDDLSPGTVNVHLEEAYNNEKDKYEVIYINGQYYPSLYNEIMTGLLDKGYNYITPITMGCLEDLGFIINKNSKYIVSTGSNMKFVVDKKEKQNGTSENYFTFSETTYDIKYLNKILKKNNIINQSILIENLKENWGNKII